MGLFDNLFTIENSEAGLTAQESFAGLLIAASACDGHIADQEVEAVTTITQRMRLFAGMSDNEWNNMIQKLMKIIQRDSPNVLVTRCVAGLPQELHLTVFANVCDLIMADGVVEPEEKVFLESLQSQLNVDGDTALTIAEVMIIKNKG